jgi:Tol biopolymer transport system component
VATRAVREVRGASDDASYAWSPDGSRFATSGPGGTVVVVDLATNRRCRVTRHAVFGTSWSPDGRLAFMLAQDEDATSIAIGVVRPCSGSDRAPVALVKVADDDGLGDILTWSPDGRRLALSLDGQV